MAERSRFEREVLPHLDAAYNLARWLTRDPHDAEDVVQDACARALRYLDSLKRGSAKAWLLTIVRNAFYDWVAHNRPIGTTDLAEVADVIADANAVDPLQAVLREADTRLIADAIAALPLQFREALILRELEELSYREISTIVGVPIGTVMSRLARARALLRRTPSLQTVEGAQPTRRQS